MAQIVQVNGENVEFPDDMSDDQIAAVIKQNTAPQGAAPKQEYKPKIEPLIEMPERLPYGVDPAAIKQANRNIAQRNAYEQSFVGDEERQQLKAQEEQRPFLSGIAEGVKHIGKEYQFGTALSPDFLPPWMQNILDYRIGGGKFNDLSREEKQKLIDDTMKQHNERYDITRMENPGATTLGETGTYIATGLIGDTALVNIGKSLSPKILEASVGANRLLGNADEAARLLNKPKLIKSEYAHNADVIGRGIITGAAEGAGQHDSSALEGAGYAALGGLSGLASPLGFLNKVRNERDAAGKQLIKEMHREGFQITPGIKTGNRVLQTEEAGIRNSDHYGQEYFNSVDRVNQRRMTDMAGEAIGLNTKNRDLLSQQELTSHMDTLRKQYTDLENNTIGKYGYKQINEVGSVLKDLQPTKHRNTSRLDAQRYEVVKSFTDQLKAELGSPRLEQGTKGFRAYRFDGKQYQGLRQRLQDEKGQAYQSGDKRLGDALSRIQTVLDDSLLSGMDKATAAQWKDLNERYAMTNMLMRHGMTPSGAIDPGKITSAVMSSDEAIRTLTGKGNRIKRFQDIARYNDILHGKDVAGGSLTGLGAAEPNPKRGLLKRGIDYTMKPIDLFRLSYRLGTNRTPFIGKYLNPASGISPDATLHLHRAAAQSETPRDLAVGYYDELQRKIDEILGKKQ